MTTYVLVHGGFVDGWYWAETAQLLEKEGHTVHVADLPSTGTDPAVLGSLPDDVAEVRRLVAAAGEPVVLVGHSYGGMVITELGDDPRVAHTVYLSALWVRPGQTLLDAFAGTPPEWLVMSADGTAVGGVDDRTVLAATLCADLEPGRQGQYLDHLMLSSAAAMTVPATAPQPLHPTTYVVLEQDCAIPPAAQEAMAAQADRIERLGTSHAAMLADPEGLVAILTRLPA